VLQSALQRALERADQVRDIARIEAWLGRLVRNVVVDELRRKRENAHPIEELELAAPDDVDGLDCSCVLVQANQLKPEHSQILRRVVVDGVSVSQVAAELAITANNAMVRLHRARTALKAQLKEHCGTTSVGSCADCGCDERGCCPQP
jgi:RNA polymerase sigma-70 factor (ECF subfamily)